MTTQLKENEFLLRCSCSTFDHIAMLVHEPDNSRGNNLKGEADDWYLLVMLNPYGFLKRLRLGIKYILAPHSLGCGMFAELVLRTQDIVDLEDFLYERRNGVKRL